jgi:GNAT superfamily N-acetyltransferase
MVAVTASDVAIRDARPTDATAIGATQAEAWRVGYRDIFAPEDLARLVEQRRTARWPATFDAPTFADTTLLVAERPRGIVGFVHLGPSRTRATGTGEIYSFNVHPEEWGRGVAAALMRDARDTLAGRGHHTIRLWTFRDAGRARRFYEKTGFRATGRTRHDRPAGGPAVTEVEYGRAIARGA